MMKKLLDGLFRFALITIFMLTYILEPMSVVALDTNETLGDLKRDLADLKAKKQQQDNEKKKTESEIQANKNAIYKANQEIEEAGRQIEVAETEIKNSETRIEELTLETEKLLAFTQMMQNDNAYLEYLSGSASITELIMRLRAVEQITDYNKENLETLEELIKKNEQLKIDLAKKQEQNEQKKIEYQEAIDSLGSNLADIAEVTEDINSEIKSKQELIDTYTKMGCNDEQTLASCARVIESKTWLKPFEKGKITSAWGYRVHPVSGRWQFHNGIDIAVGEGTTIYSATNGQVVAITDSSCGGRKLYITSRVNGQKYTVYYYHLWEIKVKVGDVVTQQTPIATVGGGSRSKAWARANGFHVDTCTTGAHLHYGVATGWYLTDPGYGYSALVSNNIKPPGYPSVGSYFYSRTQYFT